MGEGGSILLGVKAKPSHLTKQKKKEHLPLSIEALEILEIMKSQASSPFLFPGKVEGKSIQELHINKFV